MLVAVTAILVVVSVLAGVGLGYAVWRPGNAGSLASGNSTSGGSGSSGSGSTPFGSGFPGLGLTPSGSSSSGGSSSGGSSSASPSVPTGVAAAVDAGLVDINTTLSYQGETAAGTGMVLTSSGEVLTNNHVIDGATTISATDIGNGTTYTASVVGYDRSGDLAVLQLHGASGLHTVTIGDSAKVVVGQAVVAIGNAGGVGGTPTAAGGTVTALDQPITASDEDGANAEQLSGLIEVNANVVPGDSGGPLVDSAGDVVGIDTAASTGVSFSSAGGAGYAIPINEAMTVAKEIEAGDASSTLHIGPTAFLGVDVESSGATSGGFGGLGGLGGFGLGTGGGSGSSSTVTGAVVVGVASGSPAQQAGLVQGDVITSLGGQHIDSASALSSAVSGRSPGDSVQLVWVDASGTQHTATVQLGSGPPT